MDYTQEEIYSLVGKYDNVANFFLKEGTDSFNKYGIYVTGIPIYKKKEREELENNLKNNISTKGLLKINYVLFNRTDNEIKDLRRNGIKIEDIKDVSYSRYNTINHFKKGDTRKINETIIPITLDANKIKYSSIFYSLISSRLARGEKLILEEIFEYIALYAYVNDLKIPEHLLKNFSLSKEEIENNNKFWLYYYKFKLEESSLNENEAKHYNYLKRHKLDERNKIILKELKIGLSQDKNKEIHKELIHFSTLQAMQFKTKRLLQIKVPIYWDFGSFMHIYVRHTRELQIGKNFKNKSSFQYELKDIKRLIEVILSDIKDDIINHFINEPGKKFTRHGEMAVYYQGDYYCLDISPDGKLENFYKQN